MKKIFFSLITGALLVTGCNREPEPLEITAMARDGIAELHGLPASFGEFLEQHIPKGIAEKMPDPLLERFEEVYDEMLRTGRCPSNPSELLRSIFPAREKTPDRDVILSVRPERRVQPLAAALTFDDFLGRSFKADYFPFESMENVGYAVVDIRKLEEQNPGWSFSKGLRITEAKSFAYSDFNSYSVNSTLVDKVSKGFSLNLGIFKIGSQKTMTEVFTSSKVQNAQSIFGQLDVEIKDAAYELQINSNRVNQMALNYLDKDFRGDLFNMTTAETFRSYGPFVLTSFVTGGRATAVYSAYNRSTASQESREDDMTKAVEASFGVKLPGQYTDSIGTSGSLGFGNQYGNGSSISSNISQFETSIKTLGGSYGAMTFTVPKTMDNLNVDLTQWVHSLNNPDYHTIIDVQTEGLIPISDFLLEDNFKKHWTRYLETGVESIGRLEKPDYVFGIYITSSNGKAGINTHSFGIRNRFGDIIALSQWEFYNDGSVGATFAEAMVGSAFMILSFFKVEEYYYGYDFAEIENSVTIPFDYSFTERSINEDEIAAWLDLWVENDNDISVVPLPMFSDSAKKFIDPENQMMYILYSNGSKRFGYSLFTGYGDYILDTYGIRGWVTEMPEITIDRNELLGYTLVAL